jgi:hypothetical protein
LTSVKGRASPPRRSSSQTWVLPSAGRVERKDKYFPSGLQRGAVSPSGPEVIGTLFRPSQSTIQTALRALSAWRSIQATV